VRPRVVIVALVALTSTSSPALAALTNKEIRAAVHRAKHSPNLWATVNICNGSQRTIGVRAQMPSLGFTTRMYLTIEVEAFFTDTGTWQPSPGGNRSLSLGRATHTTLQNGFTFAIDPAATAFLLRGLVTYQWKLHGKVIGQATKVTTSGHKRDLGRRGRASCTI
jgi:hypothetical protein